MKEQIKLSDLSDEQLSDILVSSIISYNVYLEENATNNKNLFLDQILDHLYQSPLDITDSNNIEKTAYEVKYFMENFLFKNLIKSYDLIGKLMDIYVIKYADLSPEKLWEKAKEDGKTLVNREIMDFVQKKLNYSPEQYQTLINFINKTTDKILIEPEKETLLDKDVLTQINLKEIKASIVALEYSKNLIPIQAEYINRESSNYLIRDDKTSNDVLINNGIITIGNSKVKNSYENREEFSACFTAFFKKENDQEVLHIGFRGTEPKAQEVIKYALNDYMNMERHYSMMEPIINEIIEKAKSEKSPNNPLIVKVSGHSLGAAMVEKFLEKNKDTDNVKFSGVAIASPGSENKANIIIDGIEKTKYLKYPVSLITNTAVGLGSLSLRVVESGLESLSKVKYLSFLKIGNVVLEKIFSYKNPDSRLMNVNHEKDLVPQIGSLAYKTQKSEIVLSDINIDEGTMTNHKSYNYYGEIAKEIIKRPQMYSEFKSVFFVEEAMKDTRSIESSNSGKSLNLEINKILTKVRYLKEKYSNATTFNQNSFKL